MTEGDAMTGPIPDPALARLEPLIGRWRIDAGVPTDLPADAGGEVEFEWLGERAFLVQRWSVRQPQFPNGLTIIGPGEGDGDFLQHYFDTRGVERVYRMSLRDGEWRLWRDAPEFSQRFIGTFSADGTTITGAWEIAKDGKTFDLDFSLTYTRLETRSANRLELARSSYEAYATGDRQVLEDLLADDFVFYSPPDPGIDRATYFERCWPNHESHRAFAYERLAEVGDDEVLVTYEAERTDGSRFRNTEILRFEGDKLTRAEVYFGWNL
jgi:ketosteroid isomerase-like protein